MDTIDLSKNDIHHVSHTRFFFFFFSYHKEMKLFSMNVQSHDTSNIINDNRIRHASNNDTIILCTSPLRSRRDGTIFYTNSKTVK